MIGFDENSSPQKVNGFLKSNFDFYLNNLDRSLRGINAWHSLAVLDRNAPLLKIEVEGLLSQKKSLARKIEGRKNRNKRIEELLRTRSHGNRKTSRKEIGFEDSIKEIDRKIIQLERSIILIKNLRTETANERKLIQPDTLVILVWMLAIRNRDFNQLKNYQIIVALLMWFSKHKTKLLSETIGSEGKFMTSEAVRRSYEKYISKPIKGINPYAEIAREIYGESFSPEYSSSSKDVLGIGRGSIKPAGKRSRKPRKPA